MRKNIQRYLALLLLLFFSLGWVACGNINDVAGKDWRTSGMVVGRGTITHTEEGSIGVLVTIDKNSAAFYRNRPEKILFDSVAFPMQIDDAKEAFQSISFDDMNGDGESDVCIYFVHKSGERTRLVWFWDPKERYVFQAELS